MIYKIHSYYSKLNSRKSESKLEVLVIAKDADHAEELVLKLFKGYPYSIRDFTCRGSIDKSLEKIYEDRPELQGISPEKGYIYNEWIYKDRIRKYYFK